MLLDESKVLAEEIDSLGHMNVRFYMERKERANRKFLQLAGVDQEFPFSLRVVIPTVGLTILGNVGAHQPEFTAFNANVSFID